MSVSRQRLKSCLPKIISKKLLIDNRSANKIIDLIRANGCTARIIGGAVRDALLGLSFQDIDITTDMLPADVLSLFKKHNYRAVATGLEFGTVTVVVDDNSYEITTLRRDIASDGRYAEVEYTDNYQEDAARRDFTINALSYDPIEEKLYDYFNGLEDLENRCVRFIGQPDNRIKEDYLRILRFFRFSSYYANGLDNEGLEACVRNAHNITKLSKERIKAEIDRLIISRRSIDIFNVFLEHDIWKYIFGFNKLDIELISRAWYIADDIGDAPLDSTLYALIMIQERPSVKQLIDLRFPKYQAKIVNDLQQLSNNIGARDQDEIKVILTEKWLSEKHWQQYFLFYIALNSDDTVEIIWKLYRKLANYTDKPIFPVKSGSLMRLGIEGKQLGTVLEKLRYFWIKSNFSLTEEQLIEKGLREKGTE